MTRRRGRGMVAVAVAAALSVAAAEAAFAKKRKGEDEETAPVESFAARVAKLERATGLLTFHLDRESGQVWLELPAPQEGDGGVVGDYLYVEGLVTGLGSNPVGLDRGQLGGQRLVRLRRLGGRLLVEELNLGFRADSSDPAERLATRQSFATAVLWAGKIEVSAPDGRSLVDLTPFLVRDAHGVAATLKRQSQGKFELDPERSAVDLDACLAFPDNLVFEALLTWSGEPEGPEVPSTSPDPHTFSLLLRHSLVRLPDDGYQPRVFDPRAGSFAIFFHDYAAPLTDTIERRWIVRHRLRTAPDAEPALVYYVDPGIPEPVRSAVVEGVGWWADAFAEAGFPGAFRVELLPEGVHPLDVRYNVVQWVHRATRGWSYGGGVVDPRTGERIKGHVSLGSLRVRQDRRIFEGLLGADASGSGAPDDPVELSLARIRQLAAHEVGHTLGLAHNFAASTYGRASVMDYPAPLVGLGEGDELDVSAAYAVGVGAWDRFAIRYAYAELPPENERVELAAMVETALAEGLVMLTDPDARPPGAAHPAASLWDNGADPVEQLALDMEVRRRALARFGPGNLPAGEPLARLEEVLATLYLRHRYQLEAAVKVVGGVEYRYAVRGDGQPPVAAIDADRQRAALAGVLATVEPAALDLPDAVLAALPPRPFGHGRSREQFAGGTAPLFDPLAAATTAAELAVSGLLQRERAARLVDQNRRDPGLPGLEEVLSSLVEETFAAAEEATPRRREIARAVQALVARRIGDLAADEESSAAVRARAEAALAALAERLQGAPGEGAEAAHRAFLRREIDRRLERPLPAAPPAGAERPAPPGSPIGGGWGECSMGTVPEGGS